ncbi:MAG: DUF2309 domain-containing protein [Deltaproteobacteria bacterium]|nr:MAG: DUF2309 domain-containing protein [Deltaproteobacteria bacterium]
MSALENTSPKLVALQHALEHTGHLVPAQNPLDRFVHHNPLHAFEHLPFDEAVEEAAQVFGTEPWWPEASYQQAFATGRIRERDLTWAIERAVKPGPVAGVVERTDLARARLRFPIEGLRGEAVDWRLTETPALREVRQDLPGEVRACLVAEAGGDAARAMRALWDVAERRAPGLARHVVPPASGVRVRDLLVDAGRADTDRLVHPVLIRWSAGFLDHGVSYWPMAHRDQPFVQAFAAHFAGGVDIGRPWLRTARQIARRVSTEHWTAEDLLLHVLEAFGHEAAAWDDVLLRSAQALSGWAGMFQRLSERPDTAPEHLGIHTTLADFLAVRLLLDLSAAEYELGAGSGTCMARASALSRKQAASEEPDRAWSLFQLAQILGLGAHRLGELSDAQLQTLYDEARALDDWTRRRIWHEAYEQRFRVETLDAVGVHTRRVSDRKAPAVRVQCAFCIDDREESMRRLLEETAPWVGTYGVAGNYGISMYYKGVQHGHPVALGPAGFEPRHLVVEQATGGAPSQTRLSALAHHQLAVSSQTLFRGAMVALGGALSAVPLSMRLLAPKLHAGLIRRPMPTETELVYEREGDEKDEHGLYVGFSLAEQIDIVMGTLEFMSLLRDFAPLVCCFGHGSSSMNNPHEAAHDCGACGGGRGGPNARLFARMANDPRVRAGLAERGVHIPDETWFVGGYHNTADDAVELYDLHRVPATHQALLAETRTALDEARALDALERCRKFENVPLGVTAAEALEHVENRNEDLAQPRPEYGHCTNAICFVGRREWSRGLFLDRRAFLCSYDPDVDPDGDILGRLLAMAVPVGAGISLEYWFSVVDPTGYGCGTKLPHNITGMVGVMDGHQSDLRTGLPWQMVELHEPVRLLCVVEATTERLLEIAGKNPAVGRLVTGGWVQLASLDPQTGELQFFQDGGFVPWRPENTSLPRVPSSQAWFAGTRGLLPPATIVDDSEVG